MTYVLQVKTDSSKPAISTHRLCVLDFKTPAEKKGDASYKKPASRCVSIPSIPLEVEPSILRESLQAAFEDMQDTLVREKFMAALSASKDGNPTVTITDSDISPEAVATYAAEKAISGKLSAEKVHAWFDAFLSDNLQLALATALQLPDQPTAEQQQKLDAAISQHRLYLGKLAGPQQLPETISKQLLKAVNLLETPDKISKQLTAKLTASLQPKEEAIAFGL